MTEIKGIIAPVCTPFYEDETVNTKELRRQIDRMIEAGIDGIFPFGTNGEGYILSFEEKKMVLEATVSQVSHRVPVYAGTGCISTKETIRQSLMAKDAGADVISIITPSFAKASQEEIYTHYKTVAEEVDMPVLLYNIPARTGNAIEPETVRRLAEIPNIVGVKDSSGDWENLKKYISIRNERPDFSVLSGNDSLILDCLEEGGQGAVAGCANVYPHVMASIYDLFLENRLEEARAAQNSIASFRAVFKYGNPNTIVKKAVNLLGWPVGECKAPFNGLCAEGYDELKRVISENRERGMY